MSELRRMLPLQSVHVASLLSQIAAEKERERKSGRVRADRSGKHVTQPGGLHDSREGQGGTGRGQLKGGAGQGRAGQIKHRRSR